MIRFKKNVDTPYGFVQIGTIMKLPGSHEKYYIERGIADPYELQKKEEKAPFETKELKTEPETKDEPKRRGRKPKE